MCQLLVLDDHTLCMHTLHCHSYDHTLSPCRFGCRSVLHANNSGASVCVTTIEGCCGHSLILFTCMQGQIRACMTLTVLELHLQHVSSGMALSVKRNCKSHPQATCQACIKLHQLTSPGWYMLLYGLMRAFLLFGLNFCIMSADATRGCMHTAFVPPYTLAPA